MGSLHSGSTALAKRIYLLLWYKSLIFSTFASKIPNQISNPKSQIKSLIFRTFASKIPLRPIVFLQIYTSLLFISLVYSTLNMFKNMLTIVFCCRISVDIHQLYFTAVKSVYWSCLDYLIIFLYKQLEVRTNE